VDNSSAFSPNHSKEGSARTVKKPKRKTSTQKKKKVEFELTLRSRRPNLPTPVAAEKLQDSSEELSKYLTRKYGKTKVVVTRRKTLPIDPLSLLVLVGIFVGEHVAGAVIEEMTKDAYQWIKRKIKGTSVAVTEKKPEPASKRKPKRR
jgi:hypothetical protein